MEGLVLYFKKTLVNFQYQNSCTIGFFLSIGPRREHTKGECTVSQEAAGCTPNRPHRNLTNKGDWAGKETLKDQHTVSPDCRVLSPIGWPRCPNPKKAKFQNNIKFKNSFVHKLFKISPALTDTKHTDMALLETAASVLEKGDEMSLFHVAKSVANT